MLSVHEVKEPQDPLWLIHKQSLLSINRWQASGRFSAKGVDETWTGHFYWQNEKDFFELNISAPLSGGSFLLKGDEHQTVLFYGEEKSVSGSDANTLLYKYTGLKLPVNELRSWLVGLPSPENGYELIQLDQSGRLQQLSQWDWTLDYKRYVEHDKYVLPDKIFLANHEFDVRLSIQNWRIN